MINNLKYTEQAEIEKDGKKKIISVPPNLVLNKIGPFIQVNITHPSIYHENLKKKGTKIPTINVKALIDTGASMTVISPAVADELKLVHTGFQKITSVQDEKVQPVYHGCLLFPWGSSIEAVPMVACPLKGYDCLIGRDILMHWHFTYNGPDGSITICD